MFRSYFAEMQKCAKENVALQRAFHSKNAGAFLNELRRSYEKRRNL